MMKIKNNDIVYNVTYDDFISEVNEQYKEFMKLEKKSAKLLLFQGTNGGRGGG